MAVKKIGHIVNTYGLKGMIKVSITTTHPELRFAPGAKVIIADELGEKKTYTVSNVIVKNSKIYYIGLEGYHDINEVEWMKEHDVLADIEPPKGEIFYDDLVGMKVLRPDGEALGEVSSVIKMPAGPYLELNGGLVPYLPDIFVEKTDKEKQEITLTKDGVDAFNSSR